MNPDFVGCGGRIRWLLILATMIPALVVSRPASGQYCMSHDPEDPLDTSDHCAAMPSIKRAFYPGLLRYHGDEYLLFSNGDNLELWDIDDPQVPAWVRVSNFQVGNTGDAEYELKEWGACDDCRYGYIVSIHGPTKVFFDLGTGPLPTFSTFSKLVNTDALGGTTFAHDGVQYLIMRNFSSDPCGGVSSPLYLFDGIDPDALAQLQCIEKDDGSPLPINGGIYLRDSAYNNNDAYLWVSDGYEIHILRVVKTAGPESLRLEYVRVLDRGILVGTSFRGVDVDLDTGLAVTTSYTTGLKVWEVTDLSNPQLLAEVPSISTAQVALGKNTVFTAAFANPSYLARTFDLADPANPQELHPTFWDMTHPWNDTPCWGGNEGSVFTRDGQYLFLTRWEVLQRYDFTGCLPQCGDNVAEPGELCDGTDLGGASCGSLGFDDGVLACVACAELDTTACSLCGDGALQLPEECDDANGSSGDGCTDSCVVESGWECTGEPSLCVPPGVCGDGQLNAGEECDDGDANGADGCSGTCLVESGWECAGEPSACEEVNPPPPAGSDAGCGCRQQRSGAPGLPAGVIVVVILLLILGASHRDRGRQHRSPE